MKAVVFGGSGFLGSHVADALTNAGYDVTLFDLKKSLYLQNVQKMIVGNILDCAAVEKAVKGCEVVYNFAGVADIDEAEGKPIETIKSNILGNTIILEACRLNHVKMFVFASSVYVYGNAGSFYRSSKQACELIIEDYHKVFGLPYTILRYGSLYGSRTDERNYIYKILKQAITEGKITSFGKGEDLREYIHVADAARCSVEVLSKEFENQYVVLTGTQPMRRKDLLVMIKEMLSNKIELEFLPVESNLHYEITPYVFNPKIAKKYVSNYYLDLGQGLLQCLKEVYKESHHYKELDNILIQE
jgi:UDP-glucose 4-epimerase